MPGVDVWSNSPADAVMKSDMTTTYGASQPHENRQPYLTVTWLIALTGIFPPRS